MQETNINLEVFNLETDFFGDLHCSSRFTDMLCDTQAQYGDYSELEKCLQKGWCLFSLISQKMLLLISGLMDLIGKALSDFKETKLSLLMCC